MNGVYCGEIVLLRVMVILVFAKGARFTLMWNDYLAINVEGHNFRCFRIRATLLSGKDIK